MRYNSLLKSGSIAIRLGLFYGWLAFFIVGASGCFQPKEGCLDLEATNLDVEADKKCEACCTYPLLRLDVQQVYDTLTFVEGNVYNNDLNQVFRLRSVAFYLSDFQLFKNATLFQVTDTIALKTYGNSVSDTIAKTFFDDFLLVRRNSSNLAIGSFRATGLFDQLRFRLGLTTAAQQVIAPAAPAGHPLQTQADSLWYGRDAGFVWLQVVVSDTAAAAVPDTISLTQADLMDAQFQTAAGQNFQHDAGFDFILRLKADYRKMLLGVDWSSNDKTAWKSRIVANLPNVFSVYQ
jgi:hypothetical protein